MTVSELMELLKDYSPEQEVWCYNWGSGEKVRVDDVFEEDYFTLDGRQIFRVVIEG